MFARAGQFGKQRVLGSLAARCKRTPVQMDG
jgi:hypothetical protein